MARNNFLQSKESILPDYNIFRQLSSKDLNGLFHHLFKDLPCGLDFVDENGYLAGETPT
jgi:hypothetical protein